MKTILLPFSLIAALALAGCTPDRDTDGDRMGRVTPDASSPQQTPAVSGSPEAQLQDALAACADVQPAVSRDQCEAEARRAYEGTTGQPPQR